MIFLYMETLEFSNNMDLQKVQTSHLKI